MQGSSNGNYVAGLRRGSYHAGKPIIHIYRPIIAPVFERPADFPLTFHPIYYKEARRLYPSQRVFGYRCGPGAERRGGRQYCEWHKAF